MKTRLILIEGLPGSGKTTAIEGLKSKLADHSTLTGEFYNEHDNPLNAFWNWGDGWVSNELIEAPYDSRRFMARILERTYRLVDRILLTGSLVVMEGYPTHLTVRNMLKMGGSKVDCQKLFDRFVDAIEPVHPLLIFLETTDWIERLEQIEKERGPAFSDIFFGSLPKTPYGRKMGIRSREQVVKFYQECNAFSAELLHRWPHEICRFDPVKIGKEAGADRILAFARNAR